MVPVPAVQIEANLEGSQIPDALATLPRTLAKIYEEHATLVFRNLRRMGVAESNVEDAVQDVFIVVHRRLSDFQGRSALKTWILGITLRVAKDYRRSEARLARRLDNLANLLWSDGAITSSPSDAVEKKEAGQLLNHLLSTLSEESREILILVELEELSVREACDALNIRLRTGQRRLRASIDAMSAAVGRALAEYRRQP